jgi:hypothetical protein
MNDAKREHDHEALTEFLQANGIEHFTGREVCTLRRLGEVVEPPPREWWDRIVPTLKIAEEIRAELGCPLIVGNGFRPAALNKRVGGARRSQHLFFRALDLDLPVNRRSHAEDFYRLAALAYLKHGEEHRVGLGLYRPWKGTRVHIDTGYRRRHWKREFTAPLLESLR